MATDMALAEDKPPELDEATNAKRRRYDRQLRLWGSHGQAAMEDCSICLLNGSATGSETLKNLVLPGIGSFTVVDGADVTEADLGNNFFLETDMIGRKRAECVTALLQELNEHVSGSYVNEDILEVLAARPDFLSNFSLVIATQMSQSALREVSAACAARKLPLVVVHTYGFLGYIRLDLGEHEVIESHPEHPFPDLRILNPPAALRQLIDTQYHDLASLDSRVFSHTPWSILLIKAVDQWRAANGDALPTAYKQKKEVRALVEGMRRVELQADQNIDEALTAVNTALNVPAPSSQVKALLAEARAKVSALVAEGHLGATSGGEPNHAPATLAARKKELAFWLMAAATDRFVQAEGGGLMPLMGTIPDMTADTATYVNLQMIFAQQASSDVAAVQAYVREIAAAEGISADDVVPADDLKRFCKNSHALCRFSYAPAAAEYPDKQAAADADGAPASTLATKLASPLSNEGPEGVAAGLYLLLRAAQAFHAQRSCWPGADTSTPIETDIPQLKACLGEVVKEIGLPPCATGGSPHVSDELLAEFVRYGGAEMHAIAAVMGGVASQEVIKAATHQYVPLTNTFVFNGATGTTATFEL